MKQSDADKMVRHALTLTAKLAKATAKVERHEEALGRCYRLTGADPDGNTDEHLAPYAVAEVQRLRRESEQVERERDHALKRMSIHATNALQCEAERDALAAELQRLKEK